MRIGIDPDLIKSGAAVVVDGQLQELHALTFFELIQFIDKHREGTRFFLEDVEHDKAVYIRPGTNRKQMLKIAQNVGSVKAIGRLLHGYLQDSGADYVLVKPLQGYYKRAKKDADFFKKLTGWEGRTNEDKRDAALLALYGDTSKLRLG
ncbi:hypothetical protein [Neptuniibacter sp.]|uniref:hypothetical protein n=1 Tax=Neptuniibacter sp. TaxID=1962643 RepID=UPI002615A8B8|nr:hypothetical protein [Neptuniibacter sp.]MCP4595737.1 hypothetical protein [Neptuniibacter sp.]